MTNWTQGAAALLIVAVSAGSAAADGGRGPADFSALDVSGDGLLTVEDIEARRAEAYADMDANGDGDIDKAEFTAMIGERAGTRAARMFDRLDSDGDGVVSRETLEARGRDRGPRIEQMIERFDEDGDGGLNEAEFETAQAEMRARWNDRKGRR